RWDFQDSDRIANQSLVRTISRSSTGCLALKFLVRRISQREWALGPILPWLRSASEASWNSFSSIIRLIVPFATRLANVACRNSASILERASRVFWSTRSKNRKTLYSVRVLHLMTNAAFFVHAAFGFARKSRTMTCLGSLIAAVTQS